MSMKDTAKSIGTKLKLNSHYTIERFGILFTVIVTSFALLLAGTVASAWQNGRTSLDTRSVYTPSFTTSQSALAGDVNNVYISEDRTRAMVLMQFSDIAGLLSTDATTYEAYLTGSNSNLDTLALKNGYTGQIAVFGSTGYMAVILDSDSEIEQQILSLTMRSNSDLVYTSEDDQKLREDLTDDGSFEKFDQWRLFVNPGASNSVESAALGSASDKLDMRAIYNEVVTVEEENEVRTEMNAQLAEMNTQLNKITEFENEIGRTNIDGLSIVPPEVPEQIAGDRVTGENAEDKDSESTLALETNWVAPSGFDFDWRAGTVFEGYLDELVPEGTSKGTFLSDKARAGLDATATGGTDVIDGFSANDVDWTLVDSNGNETDLKMDYDDTDNSVKPLRDLMNNTTQAWSDYYRMKTSYQVDSYTELLELEMDLDNVSNTGTFYSVQGEGDDEKQALTTY